MDYRLNDVILYKSKGLEPFDFYVKIVNYRHGLGFIGLFADDDLAIPFNVLKTYDMSNVVCRTSEPEFDELMKRLQPEADRHRHFWSLFGARIHNITLDIIEEIQETQN